VAKISCNLTRREAENCIEKMKRLAFRILKHAMIMLIQPKVAKNVGSLPLTSREAVSISNVGQNAK